ncbi:hypothetical protein F5144DRAFT_480371 [Chaetomium tenue]|uniref:Uncharacterized protein n=1 Tax=Chaetomium tenue TaxID=1854479 RepID=A0ACB7PQF5_9PEZI|nr:hypothetical protein F5144DRAFT_480371 [Chaetomium globosum]
MPLDPGLADRKLYPGIGGLTAALGLRQQGHEVTLFERSQLAQETGAAIHLAPNCHSILRRLGVFPEVFGANPVNGVAEYDGEGNVKFDLDLRKPLAIWQHPWVLSHRVRLHEELKRKALSTDDEGTPAVLKTSSVVTTVDPDTGTVTLEDGSSFSGDLVLGADGSITRNIVAGPEIKPFGSGKSAFRFLVPMHQVRENPITEALGKREGIMTMWIGNDRRLVMYPCSDNTMMNFVGIHPSELSASKGEGWSRGASKDLLIEVFGGFGTTVRALLEMADVNALKVWTLLDMDRIPTWYKGKLALLGDAAHPFLPHQGQGGGIAIEDAASLAALLPRGTTVDDIPERLALYEKVRDERAHKVQALTRIAGMDLNDVNREKFNIMEFMHYNFGHDEWHNSTRALREHLWSCNGPVHWRTPLSFGPMPSPRQDHLGRRIPAQESGFTTYSVRFKTSATYLKTWFPAPEFSFSSPGTVAEASFRCTELRDMKWLGGGGYKYLGLWIHGVQYARKDGSKVHGSFLVVLLESLADPIITGRDELGMPKLFSDIDIDSNVEGSVSIECSWRGQQFLRLHLDDLKEGPADKPEPEPEAPRNPHAPPKPKDEGTIAYRYVPAVGKPGEADAAYAVLFREGNESAVPRVVQRTYRSQNGRLEFTEGNWDNLPTLHHIAAGFAEIPVYGVVEAKTEEGTGVDDLANAERIE